ncbi:MAG: phage tail protein, partial [Solirubrobacterales bacterium]
MMPHAKLFCLTVIGILAAFTFVSPVPGALRSVAPAPDARRSFVSGNFMMNLDGQNCGYVKGMEGGGISAEVINEPAGPSYFVKKHIGQPKYEEITVQVGFSMTKALYEWIAQSWKMNYQRKDGSIIILDRNMQPQSERKFTQALITETTIPAMDIASKEPAYMTVKFAPETIRVSKPTGAKSAEEFGKNEQKVFLPSNFKLQIDGLDCSKVMRIESFTVKQTTVTDDIGEARDYAKEPGKLEFPNLKLTIPESAAQGFVDWHNKFVIEGNNDEANEKGGTLTLLSPNLKTELAKISFFNMGIFRIRPDTSEANTDAVKRL